MTTRRDFVTRAAGFAGVLPAFRPDALARAFSTRRDTPTTSASSLADDEAYWGEIQRAFDSDRTMVNLNNGGVSPTPTHVLEAMIRDLRFSNELPVHHMWAVLEPRIESVRRDLAHDFGCDPEEMAIVRNASEALETMILGLDLEPGDEVLVTNQNYGRMITTWDQRVRRDGIVLKQLSFPVPPPSPEFLVKRFEDAITPRTKVIEITHITNLTGQIFPVRAITEMARQRGITTFIDGAHAYAHFPFTRDELGVDYYGTSLHKWLLAPIGTGFLYVRKEKQPGLWPLMAAPEKMNDNIRKYEEIGTHPAANHNAISAALAFHRGIGADRKIARLRYLRDRWARALLDLSDRVSVPTPLDGQDAGAIALLQVEGLDMADLHKWLLDQHRIVTVPIKHPEFTGIRVTPNVYTTLDEIDLFVDRVSRAIRTGLA
ncbi:MAG TPA: aminotransferase class V-fold PLP-dependent enzyme [Gemmatimonadales bacterium]|nr:aminotransferase class V-fold PLP-dependent enzyme [Gemmatimonadales bacterium]